MRDGMDILKLKVFHTVVPCYDSISKDFLYELVILTQDGYILLKEPLDGF